MLEVRQRKYKLDEEDRQRKLREQLRKSQLHNERFENIKLFMNSQNKYSTSSVPSSPAPPKKLRKKVIFLENFKSIMVNLEKEES